jgi:hypothetical protein
MTTDFYPTKNHLDVPVSGAIRNSEMSKNKLEHAIASAFLNKT